ncbi:MAG: uroporphyrinogen decarboxylase family protein, partial [Christensenella sp.]
LKKELFQRFNTEDVVKAYDMPIQYIELPPAVKAGIDYSVYHQNASELSFIDEWGVGHKRGSVEHFTHMYPPMGDFETPQEVQNYPFPDMLCDERWQSVRLQNEAAHKDNRATAFFAVQVFEPAWYLRGLDNLLVDMLTDHDMAFACMNKMTEIQCKIAAKAAQCGVDIIVFGDDVGTQRALMLSLDAWREWIMPATAATIKAAKAVNPDVLAFYHSDGVIDEIIPDLIKIGVDILNPIQPECVNPIRLKELYGDKLSFWGTIGTQTTMPFGTENEVRENVRKMIETVGEGGGFCVAPTHLLEPEVPWANINAFVSAVNDFGKY